MGKMTKNQTTGKYELNITPSSSAQTKTIKVGSTYCDADIDVNVDAIITTPITPAFKGGAISGSVSDITGYNVGLSDTSNGISVTASASATRADVLYDGSTIGYVNKANNDLAFAAPSSNTSLTDKKKYITSITVPKDTPFTMTVTADTAYDTTSYVTIINNAYRRINLTNYGRIYHTVGSSTQGQLYVNAYDSSGNSLSGDQQIVSSGKWVTYNITPSTSAKGPYYGLTNVAATPTFSYTTTGTQPSTSVKTSVYPSVDPYYISITTAGWCSTGYFRIYGSRVKPNTSITTGGQSTSSYTLQLKKGQAAIVLKDSTTVYWNTSSAVSNSNSFDVSGGAIIFYDFGWYYLNYTSTSKTYIASSSYSSLYLRVTSAKSLRLIDVSYWS